MPYQAKVILFQFFAMTILVLLLATGLLPMVLHSQTVLVIKPVKTACLERLYDTPDSNRPGYLPCIQKADRK